MWPLARVKGYICRSALRLQGQLLCRSRPTGMLLCLRDLRPLEAGTSWGARCSNALWLLLRLIWATRAQTPCCRLHMLLLQALSDDAALLLAWDNVPWISVCCAASYGRLPLLWRWPPYIVLSWQWPACFADALS